jgi:hypothetical protein
LKSLAVDAAAKALSLLPTWLGGETQEQEDSVIRLEQLLEDQEGTKIPLAFVGSTYIDGSLADNAFPMYTPTLSADLTFSWHDPSTGLPTSGPAVSAVQYYVWNGMTESLDLSSAWTLLGTSSDSASGFEVSYSFPFGEDIFLSAPLDTSGQPIVINGVDGYNDAESIAMNTVPVPEPASMASLAVGALGFMKRPIRRSSK